MKAIKVLLVIALSALTVWLILSWIYGSIDLKLKYYKWIEPVMKH